MDMNITYVSCILVSEIEIILNRAPGTASIILDNIEELTQRVKSKLLSIFHVEDSFAYIKSAEALQFLIETNYVSIVLNNIER